MEGAMGKWAIGVAAFGITAALVGALVALSATVLMWAWNASAVALFHAPRANFWEALGAVFLIGLIGSAFRSVAR